MKFSVTFIHFHAARIDLEVWDIIPNVFPLLFPKFSLAPSASTVTATASKVQDWEWGVDLRMGDVTAITSKLKSYCYQDLYQNPSEVLLYRRVEEG